MLAPIWCSRQLAVRVKSFLMTRRYLLRAYNSTFLLLAVSSLLLLILAVVL